MSTPSICEIIARLGNSCVPGGLPWARCRCTSQANRGIPEGYPCTQPRGHAGDHRNRGASWRGWADPLPPMLTEWAAEWERGQKCPDCGKPPRPGHDVAAAVGPVHCDPVTCRGFTGEPGPVASWTDGRVEWSVARVGNLCVVRVRVGGAYATKPAGGRWRIEGEGEGADVLELGRLMQAVDGGGR